jgi:hypothetical protein
MRRAIWPYSFYFLAVYCFGFVYGTALSIIVWFIQLVIECAD